MKLPERSTPAEPGAPAAPDGAEWPAVATAAPRDRGSRPHERLATSAGPLALAYAALITYASLYPFADWRDQGIGPFAYLFIHLPHWWTWFDVITNVIGYAPFGFLLALTALRSGWGARGVVLSGVVVSLWSLAMETTQSYLPARVPSNLDFLLNSAGGMLGILVAAALERLGAIARWSRVRERWLVPDARGGLVLLLLWPVALLFPVAVPFGLGQVLERLEDGLAGLLQDTPFLAWLPSRTAELLPLSPGAQMVSVMLGALAPCLLVYSIVWTRRQRAVGATVVLLGGVMVTALSAALSFSPTRAWAWVTAPVLAGIAGTLIITALVLPVSRRGAAAIALLVLAVQLDILNGTSTSAYFWQTLQTWEQGRFIRFHGLVQWLGWLWPYGALLYLLLRLSRTEASPQSPRRLCPFAVRKARHPEHQPVCTSAPRAGLDASSSPPSSHTSHTSSSRNHSHE
jgi:VanZ family protein